MDKLTDIEDAIWGKQATEAIATEKMLGAEVFTDALRNIANSKA